MLFILHVTCSCISHAYVLSFSYIWYIWIAWDFSDCSSLLLLLNLFTLVVSMAPKHKSTPAQNPLRFGASSSTDPSPFNVRFRDDDAFKAFSENFSRRSIHSERQSFCRTLPTLTFPLSFTVGDGSHCVMSRSHVLSCLSRSFTSTCMGLIVQYLSFSLAFEVRAFLSHRSWLQMCFGSLG